MSALEVKRLTAPGMHFVGEIPGLALQVLPTGGRTWVLRVVVARRRRDIGLGGYPEVSLATARDKARDYREQIKKGIDPLAEARALKAAMRPAMTFRSAAMKYIEAHRTGWRNPKHAQQWENTLEQYAYPHIGAMNVADIQMADILAVLEQKVALQRSGRASATATPATLATVETARFWEARTETAVRLRQRMELVLDWSKGRGYRSGDNPAAWRGCLDTQLPKPGKVRKREHHTAMALDDMGDFMVAVRNCEGMAAKALEFAILCASRSGEVRQMTWSEVDLDAGVWTIPGERMKAGREHRVPLSKAALDLLEALPRLDGVDLVFPSPRGGAMSDMSLTAVLRRMGREEVPHGFRSTFRDWAAERTHYPSDMAEMALAHTISNAVEAAYRRGDQMEKRRQMMADWAAFCSTASPVKGKVIGIRSKASAA
jgi:integrase